MCRNRFLFVFAFWLIFYPASEPEFKNSETIETIVTTRGGSITNPKRVAEKIPFLKKFFPISEERLAYQKKLTKGRLKYQKKLIAKKDFYQTLESSFPDSDERSAYQKKQTKIALLAMKKAREAKRTKVSVEYTTEELDALNYFKGENNYKDYQDPKTVPNVFDTRKSFLLKMRNEEMRKKFLRSYHRNKSFFDEDDKLID